MAISRSRCRTLAASLAALATLVVFGFRPSFAEPGDPAVAKGLLLAERGRAVHPVIISADASEMTRAAAQELAEYLGLITGGVFEVKAGDGSTGVVVGPLAEFPDPLLSGPLEIRNGFDGREAFAIRTDPNRVRLIGATDLATSHAVWRFLETLGYRHFFPAKEWEVIPKIATLTYDANETSRPAILSRAFSFAFAHYGFDDPALAAQDEWRRHNRVAQSFQSATGHSVQGIILTHAQEFEKHPEWLALRNGSRLTGTNTHNFEIAQFCLSNAELRRHVVQWSLDAFEKDPALDMVSLEPNDGIDHCECLECEKLGATSERTYLLANEVARALSQKYPGKMVGMLAYSDHSTPPTIPLEPNIHVQLTHGYNYGDYTFDQLLAQWEKKTTNLGSYTYWSVFDQAMDMPYRHRASQAVPMTESITLLASHGMKSIQAESASDWGISGRGYYLASRLMWDPKADPDAVLKDFYEKAFGPAAAPMQRFYESLDGTEVAFPGEHNIGQAFLALGDASRMAEQRPDVMARLTALKQYAHYVHLYTLFGRARDNGPAGIEEAKQLAPAILRHVVRTRSNMLNAWVPFVAGWSEWKSAEYHERSWSYASIASATPDQPSQMAQWFELAPPEADEIQRDFEEAREFFPVPPAWEAEKFSSELVAVNWDIEPQAQPNDRWRTAVRYAYVSTDGEPLIVSLGVGRGNGNEGWNGAISYRLLDDKGHAVHEGAAQPDQGVHRVEMAVSSAGTYFLELNDPYVNIANQPTWHIAPEPGTAFSLDLTRGSVEAVGHQSALFFYVPKGTRELRLFSGLSYKPVFFAPDGKPVRELDPIKNPADRGFLTLPVAEGQDGRTWAVGGEPFVPALIRFFNAPSYFASRPEQLVIPRDLALRDGLTLRASRN